jgi:hypothetical protein
VRGPRARAYEACSGLKGVEAACIIVIAIAVLVGGSSLLLEIGHFRAPASFALAFLAIVQLIAVRRNALAGGPHAQVRASRDVAFLAAIVAALIFVWSPARWSLGACIAGVEFGLVLELLARLVPEAGQPR